ncbi:TrkA family potassium uptake protein [Williamsia sp.]|uniref:potassium channel family protein n=1 Tax=Williamsia sp. TaxID=1872085 RepID=UPI001A24AB6B|nr:TrkA family potassium uptake protein [Williamsia sp.]MBJ7288376.1 TrkA family potassium uptake protein [Williamsia sp.]
MRVVIMGCGRVGSSLALALEDKGHSIAVVDRDESAFRRLGPGFRGTTVRGVGFDQDILRSAGIAEADAFAAVSSGDNSNIIAARVARETFGVEKVVARIYDAKRAAVYERLGIPTVATVPWTTQRFVAALGEGSPATAWKDPSGSVVVTLMAFHESWVGQTVKAFQEETGARVAFINRLGNALLPEPRTVLQQDDNVFVAVLRDNRENAAAIAGAQRDGGQ